VQIHSAAAWKQQGRDVAVAMLDWTQLISTNANPMVINPLAPAVEWEAPNSGEMPLESWSDLTLESRSSDCKKS